MFFRYANLHKRSMARSLEIFFWPIMNLLVMGFLTMYVQEIVETKLAHFVVFLINAMIFWDVLYRAQQGVTLSVIEDVWTQNIQNIFISPLRVWEWLASMFLYGLVKTLIITVVLSVLALIFYHFNIIDRVGLYLIPLLANLLLFGWALGRSTRTTCRPQFSTVMSCFSTINLHTSFRLNPSGMVNL